MTPWRHSILLAQQAPCGHTPAHVEGMIGLVLLLRSVPRFLEESGS
jgi:hypothetical protein